MSRIGYRRHTVCLGLVVLLALSSCGKKAEDTAAGGSPGASSAPTTAASPPEAATSPTTSASSPGAATSGSTTASSPGTTSSSSAAGGVKPNGTVCPASAPVKGNISKKRGKIYFTTKFPDYKNVKPETCFADVAAAKSAGFRSPKAAK